MDSRISSRRSRVRGWKQLDGKDSENVHHRYSNQWGVGKLHLRSYGIRAVQELLGPDTETRLQYCRWFLSFVQENGLNMLDVVYFNN